MAKLLDLSDGIRSTVYSIIVTTLKNDPKLKTIVKSWKTYTEESDDDAPVTSDALPAVEILPYGGGAKPASIVTQESPLLLQVSVCTEGLDVRDLLNLWEAVERALFTGDGTSSLLGQLRAGLAALKPPGGNASCVGLLMPAIKPVETALNKQQMLAAGTLQINLRVPH